MNSMGHSNGGSGKRGGVADLPITMSHSSLGSKQVFSPTSGLISSQRSPQYMRDDRRRMTAAYDHPSMGANIGGNSNALSTRTRSRVRMNGRQQHDRADVSSSSHRSKGHPRMQPWMSPGANGKPNVAGKNFVPLPAPPGSGLRNPPSAVTPSELQPSTSMDSRSTSGRVTQHKDMRAALQSGLSGVKLKGKQNQPASSSASLSTTAFLDQNSSKDSHLMGVKYHDRNDWHDQRQHSSESFARMQSESASRREKEGPQVSNNEASNLTSLVNHNQSASHASPSSLVSLGRSRGYSRTNEGTATTTRATSKSEGCDTQKNERIVQCSSPRQNLESTDTDTSQDNKPTDKPTTILLANPEHDLKPDAHWEKLRNAPHSEKLRYARNKYERRQWALKHFDNNKTPSSIAGENRPTDKPTDKPTADNSSTCSYSIDSTSTSSSSSLVVMSSAQLAPANSLSPQSTVMTSLGSKPAVTAHGIDGVLETQKKQSQRNESQPGHNTLAAPSTQETHPDSFEFVETAAVVSSGDVTGEIPVCQSDDDVTDDWEQAVTSSVACDERLPNDVHETSILEAKVASSLDEPLEDREELGRNMSQWKKEVDHTTHTHNAMSADESDMLAAEAAPPVQAQTHALHQSSEATQLQDQQAAPLEAGIVVTPRHRDDHVVDVNSLFADGAGSEPFEKFFMGACDDGTWSMAVLAKTLPQASEISQSDSNARMSSRMSRWFKNDQSQDEM